jgi:hypothetical protein
LGFYPDAACRAANIPNGLRNYFGGGDRSINGPAVAQFAKRLPDDLPATANAQAGQNRGDCDVGPSGSGSENPEGGCHNSQITNRIVARAYPYGAAIGIAVAMPP